MRAKVEPRLMTFLTDVWLYDEELDGRGVVVYRPGPDGTWTPEPAAPGTTPEPSLTLPRGALEALVAAGSDFLPPSSAQAAHLTDACGVRDRLLAIVEHTTGANAPTSS